MSAPERIWAASVTENYGEWQTTTDGLPRPTEYVRADLVTARCSSCDGTGDVHRADGEWLGECNCGSEFRHAYDVEASPSKAFRVIHGQDARIVALEAQLAEARQVVALFENYGCPVCHGDCASSNPPVYSCPMQAASRVREGGKVDG